MNIQAADTAAISRRFATLSEAGRKELKERLRARHIDLSSLPIVSLRSDVGDGLYPLSVEQERLWFLWRLEPGSSSYTMSGAVRLDGALDAPRLHAALTKVTARHESLRTRFTEIAGDGRQRIVEAPEFDWTQRDVTETTVTEAVASIVTAPFDLVEGPLLRAGLLRLSEEAHVLVVTMHHVISDGWSIDIFLRELSAVYEGAGDDLPPVALQYIDYALWQRAMRDDAWLETQLAYWRELLGDGNEPLRLPIDRQRGRVRSTRGGRASATVRQPVATGLRKLAQETGTTLFVVLLAAWQALLHRYAGTAGDDAAQGEVRVGVPFVGRDRPEVRGTIGFFLNTLVLQAEIGADTTFADLVAQQTRRMAEAREHADVPFAQIVDALGIERSLAQTPIFQTMFNLRSGVSARPKRLGAAMLSDFRGAPVVSQYDLALDAFDRDDGLRLNLTYIDDAFEPATGSRILDNYLAVLTSVADDREQRIGDMCLDGRDPQAPADRHTFHPVTARLRETAARTPTTPCVTCGEERLDHGELDVWSDAIAARLQTSGVIHDEPVGLCVERSVALVAALVGILKSGGAYLPLDPDYPADRLRHMVRDAGIRRIVADAETARRLAGIFDGCEIIEPVRDNGRPTPQELHPDQLASIVYTSGSTGTPKGVGVSHGALSQHFDDFLPAFDYGPSDVALQFSTINFDAAVEQMLPLIAVGGHVVLRGPDAWTPAELTRCIIDHRLTIADVPTSFWQEWMAELPEATCLRRVTVGGEALAGDQVARWRRGKLGAVRLDNRYGPTETTMSALFHETGAADEASSVVSIGRPYPGRSARVLDQAGDIVPAGGYGELCIGGDSLARGYVGRPGLTAERFVPDPEGVSGGRLYRTGDLCRPMADGSVAFLGRLDRQVKLRGLRVELGEIEAALRAQSGVRDAIVELRGQADAARLIGYLVEQASDRVSEVALAEALSTRLPAHMIPSAFVRLNAFPVTPAGKLDRAALPDPEQRQSEAARRPATDAEATLCRIVADLLAIPEAAPDENFFRIGGDSILSLRLVARARDAGLTLTPRQIFETPVLERLAAVARPVNAIVETDAPDGPVPLTPIQAAFFRRHPDGEPHWNQSVLLRIDATFEETRLDAAVAALVEAHEALRLRFSRSQGRWGANVGPIADAYRFEAIDLSKHPDTIGDVAASIQTGLDIEHGPLVRAALLTLGDGERRLLIVIHHLVVDGVSWRILIDDLQRAWAGHALAARPPWSRWARALATYRDTLSGEDNYWRDALAPATTWPAAPVSLRRDARKVAWQLDRARTDELLHRTSHAWRTSTEDILATALATAIARIAGTDGGLVLMEGHGREDVVPDLDLSTMVGWFTTQYPVWLPATARGRGLRIVDVKEALRAVPRRGLHWGLLANDMHERLPQPRVGFNYLGRFDEASRDGPSFSLAKEDQGPALSPDAPLDLALDINGAVTGGVLRLTFLHDPQALPAETLDRLVEIFDTELEALIDTCVRAPAGATPSDFPLAPLSVGTLARRFPTLDGIEDIYAATSVQSGMLYHGLRSPGTGLYVGQLRLRLGKHLDIEALRRSFVFLIDRHAILRTGFELSGDGGVLQVVRSRVDWDLDVVEPPSSTTDYEVFASKWCAADRTRGFDAARAPLMRGSVLHRPDGGHDLVWTCHHALLDGWSQSRLLGELSLAYEALRADSTPSPGPVRPYKDYIAWLARRDEAASEAWWRTMFAGADPALLLPSLGDARSGGDTSTPGAEGHTRETLPEATSAALRAAARRHGLTFGTLLQGAWAILLSRYGGRRRVAFGVTVSGRPAELDGADTMLGLFINSLPVWVDVRADANLWSFLGDLQHLAGGLREHEHTPLPSLQRWSGRGSESLFDSLLVFENYPIDSAAKSVSGDLAPHGAIVVERPHYPLTLSINEGKDGLALRWLWDGARLRHETVATLRRDFAAVLEWISSAGDAFVGRCSLPGSSSIEAGTSSNRTRAEPFGDVLSRIESRPRDAVAVVYENERLDYGTLLSRASNLSRRLGPSIEERVGLCTTRSAEMVWALIGIIGAGAAYVPLDPTYPKARLVHALEDAGIRRVVADATGAEVLRDLASDVEVIRLDEIEAAPREPLTWARPHPRQLAYVIYTSGSTGRPKGVGISHESLAALIDAARSFGIREDDCWSLFHSLSFDFSVWEIFVALANGCRLVVVPPDVTRDPDALHALLRAERVTVFNQTPSAFGPLMQVDIKASSKLDDLRLVFLGAEKLSSDMLDPWRAARGKCMPRVYVTYGITETTVIVTTRVLEGGERPQVIGRPLDLWSTDLLGEDGQRVPIGGTGEICVGGIGMARGYLGRPGLTAERFVPDPSGAPGATLYRSGDLAATTLDGELIYRSRADRQVKLRGFRIELGEIESALRRAPGVGTAAVVLRADRLIGYLTGGSDSETVRAHLSASLPAHMLPHALVNIDRLPLTPSGKLDEAALPEPEQAQTAAEAPVTETERAVCTTAAEVLGLDTVGVTADFFAAGGDSISAMRFVATLASRTGRDVPLARLFEMPVLRDFAARIGTAPRTPIEPRSTGAVEPYPLSVEQERLWFLWRLDPSSAAYTMSGAVRLDGALDAKQMREALTEVVRRHESLRTRFVEIDGEGRQRILEEPDFDWIQSDVAEATAVSTAVSIVTAPFDLVSDPVLRAGLLRIAPEAHVLVLAMHHIVSDAWSMDILLREVAAFYEGVGDDLSPVALQYADYAVWQRRAHDATWIEAQIAYWRELLGGRDEPLRLPVDRQRGRVRSTRGGRVSADVPDNVVADLRRLAKESGTTLFVVLLSAWQALLHRYAGTAGEDAAQGDIRVGVPFAGRERPELHGTIGFFLNTLVLKAEIGVDMTLIDLISQQSRRMAAARAHADVPFAQVVDALGIERNLADTPVFQTMFNLVRAGNVAAPRGLVASAVETPVTTARYELALNVVEDGNELRASLGFACDLFEPATVEALLAGWVTMLSEIAAEPRTRIGAVRLDERGSHAIVGVAPFKPTAARVAATAREKPDAIALCCEGASITFAMLEARAEAIAGRLQDAGVATETRVGLCLARGLDLVAAMLGVMKAGGVFVPLDPDHPVTRLRDIAQDAALSLILTDSGTAETAASLAAVPILNVDDASAAPLTSAAIHPDQLAYVLYTSGSTGRPKGIGINHRALSLHLDDFIKTHEITDRDVVLNSSTLGFDVALHEILPALIQGGRVVMRGPAPWSLERLTTTLIEEGVTFARIPTALWQQWIRAGVPPLPVLRQITVGGEGLPGDALKHWYASRLTTTALDNLYGPTEIAVAALRHRVTKADAASLVVSIGRPYPGRSARVLDLAGDLVPAGGYGELCIGGESLARGYVGRPGPTAERFVPDPEGAPGSRIYRTGDLCRPTADGSVSFLGRLDRQVKLRGLRIELGEIEAALRAQPGVSDAIVELRDQGETARLIGYVVGETSDAALTEALTTQLPSHMIPATFVHLERLPVTPTGKLDRAALPEPAPRAQEARRAPTTAEEATLCRIVADVLAVSDVGPDDNFFRIGGDSLSALRLVAACVDAGLSHVDLTGVFASATLAALAAPAVLPSHVKQLNTTAATKAFCFHPSFGMTADYVALAQALSGRVTLYGLDSPFLSEDDANIVDFADLAAHHVRQMRQVQPNGPYRLAGWSLGGWLAIEAAHQLLARGETIEVISLIDTVAVAAPDAVTGREVPMDDEATLAAVREVGGAHLIPDSIRTGETAVLRGAIRAYRHHNRLLAGYRLPKVEAPLHVWWSGETAARWPELMGWSSLATDVRSVDIIEGSTHLDVVKHPRAVAAIGTAMASKR